MGHQPAWVEGKYKVTCRQYVPKAKGKIITNLSTIEPQEREDSDLLDFLVLNLYSDPHP